MSAALLFVEWVWRAGSAADTSDVSGLSGGQIYLARNVDRALLGGLTSNKGGIFCFNSLSSKPSTMRSNFYTK